MEYFGLMQFATILLEICERLARDYLGISLLGLTMD